MNDNPNTPKEQGKGASQQIAKPKLNTKAWVAIVVLVLIGGFVWWGFQPITGTVHVGICRTFAELKLRYPSTIRITDAYVFEKSQRLAYTFIDPYGHRQLNRIDCRFKYPLSSNNLEIESITINRQPIPRDEVALFNLSIPAIVAAGPNNVIPWAPGDTLMSLKTD